MTSRPVVSILINNYNYANFLGDAIDSALGQTYTSFEVIVVDDGSTDASKEVILRYDDKITPVLKQNEGQASAFNAGFSVSKGDIICFLDADDVFLPHKLKRVVSSLQSESDEVGWCFHPLKLVDSNLSTLKPDLEPDLEAVENRQQSFLQVDVRHRMARGELGEPFVIPATSGMCFTRSCLKQIIPMPTSRSVSLNDSYIKFAAMGTHKGIIVSDRLALQRIHGQNLFTLRENNRDQKAEIFINTAFYIRKNFPTLSNFSDSLLATGLHLNPKVFDKESHDALLVKEYLNQRPFSSKVKIKIKQLFYKAKRAFLG